MEFNMNSIRNFLILSLIVASVPVEAAHTTKTANVASQTKHSKKCSGKHSMPKDDMGIGLFVLMILYTPIAIVQNAYYRKRKASEAKKAETLKRKLQKERKKSASENTSCVQP